MLKAIKDWLNTPLTETQRQVSRGLNESFTGVDYKSTTRGGFPVSAIGQGLKHYGGSMPGSINMSGRRSINSASSTEISETIPCLGTRASEIHTAVPKATQNRTTIAVGEVIDANGQTIRIVGSSESRLRPAQRALLQNGEVEATGQGHVETTVINYAKDNDLNINSMGASRPICANCAT